MAPFARGRGFSRGSQGFHARGGSRGRGSGNVRAHGNRKATFISSRVEEPVEHEPDMNDESQGLKVGENESAAEDLSSESDQDIAASTNVKPYNMLLQSLNANIQRGQPERKKRKIENTGALENNEDLDQNLDLVEEPEEAEFADLSDAEDDDEPDDTDNNDPFKKHFADLDEISLARQVSDIQNDKLLAKFSKDSFWSSSYKYPASSKEAPSASARIPQSTRDLRLKQKFKQPAARILPVLNGLIRNLASSMFNYQDILYGDRSFNTVDDVRKLTCLHLLNHITKTRDRVIKNNARFAKEDEDGDLELRDQGFTRPKVLVILPTRQSCLRYLDTIIALCEPEQQENRKRFQDSYAQGEDGFSEDKPADFKELFGGNNDDMFRLGVKFTRKTVKYFAQFYNSDVIFASPLGLRMALGAEDDKKQDHDFLSSIEILIVDQADALQMQNWEHVEYIFDHLNLQPKEAHGCDFSRVRSWYLDGRAKYLRQSILLSAFNFPSLNKLYTSSMLNVAGKVKFSKLYDGVMLDLGITLRQTFSRYESTSPVTDPDDRFNYFTSTIVPHLTRYSDSGARRGQGMLIYLPLYVDFVRVRNHLASSSTTQNISFGSISEYTSVRDVARARSHFFTGRHSVLLYTERAHHFRRYHLRGVKKVVMYGLPDNPMFYQEIVGGFLGSSIAEAKVGAAEASVRSLFSRLDVLKLERIVGSERYVSLLRHKGGDTFDFI